MKKPAKIAILNSIISIALCLVLMAGATLAVFTSKSATNIAVTSGSVYVVATPSLTKASSAEWSEQESGYTYPSLPTAGNRATFTNGGTVSIDGGKVTLDRITPGDSATIQIDIRNNGTIDAKFQIKAAFGDGIELLDVLDVTLKDSSADLGIVTNSYAEKASKWYPLKVGGTETFHLSIEFPIEKIGSAALAAKTANITLTVLAYQGNAYTEDPTEIEPTIATPKAPVNITAEEINRYKILKAEADDDYDFLYWAYQPAYATAAAYTADASFGSYVTNQPVYKFRVTEENIGTYTAVYQLKTNLTSVIRLTPESDTYTFKNEDVKKQFTFVAEDDTWYLFTGFTLNGSSVTADGDGHSYTLIVGEDHVNKQVKAEYTDFDLETYEDYFDNTGAIDYEATIISRNVERNIPEDYSCGGIDEEFTVGEFASAGDDSFKDALYIIDPNNYPIYGKGYLNYKSNEINKDAQKKAEYTKLNKAVFAETTELSQFGNHTFMGEDGKLWEFKERSLSSFEEYQAFQEEIDTDFCKEYGTKFNELQEVLENGEVNLEKFDDLLSSAHLLPEDKYPEWYIEYGTYNGERWANLWDWFEVGHLYKHSESQNMYLGDVSNEQPAVEKVISATPRGTTQGWSPTITGLYAPAGEVITFKMSAEDMERTGGMIVTIGMVQMPGLPLSFGVDRYPSRPARIIAQTTLTSDIKHPEEIPLTDDEGNYVFHFGSYLGGPIYVTPVNAGEHFTVDISGAVEYQHYIYGVTTEDEFEARQSTTAPYFECWVSTEDVRFVGPRSQVSGAAFTYENFVKVSRLWENTARISKRFPSQSNSEYGIMVMFEAYVQSGAACAFAGANTVDSPYGWMGGALGYESIVESGGWGNFHEFNHCYQYFGIGADSEVSNNTVNLVEYALLTEISAHRAVDADGISTRYTGWEAYTDPAFTLRVLTGGNPANGSRDKNICRYENLFYSFGLDRYVEMTQITSHYGGQIWGSSRGSYPFFRGASEGSGYNMEYYFNEIVFPKDDKDYGKYHIDLNNDFVKNDYENEYSKLPMFVPVACTYQTGVGHAFDPETGKGVDASTRTGEVQWEYTTTSRPFRIDFNTEFKLDFERTLAIPGRSKDTKWEDTQFDWTISLTDKPTYGQVTQIGETRNFTYTPDANARKAGTSGRMVFTVTYEGKEGTVAANIRGSVQIVVQFDAKPGTTRVYDLDRTVYTYAEGIEEDKDTESGEGSEGSEGVAAAAETQSPFEAEYSKWLADLQNAAHKYDGTFEGALYVTTEDNVLPDDKEEENNTAVWFDENHPAPADSFVVVSGIYTPKGSGTYYLGLESLGVSALYISTDGKTYTLLVTCGPDVTNTGDVITDNVDGVYRAAKKIALTAGKSIYFREVFAPDPEDPNDHVRMLWGDQNCSSTDKLTDRPTEGTDHEGCAYCVKDVARSYELEYLETRDQYFIEKSTATQEMFEVRADERGFKINETGLPGFATPKKENFFDEDPYNPFRVDGSSGTLTIIGKMCDPDTGEATSVTADFFTIRTEADNAPLSYQLFVGNDEANINTPVFEQKWSEYGSRPRLQRMGTLEHPFNGGEKTFQYYKLVVTQANGRLILYGIEFGNRWNVKQPSDRDVEKLGAWENVRTNGSTFGYLLTANGATDSAPVSTLTVNFTGKELHIRALVGKDYGAVELLIDGVSIADIDLRQEETGWVDILSEDFLSEEVLAKLKEALGEGGEHKLVLRSVERFNVDAIYYR